MQGVYLTPLRIIEGEIGNVMHLMKQSAPHYAGFGEAYISTVKRGAVKGWKRHHRMVLNLVVPMGAIEFLIFDDRDGSATQGAFQLIRLQPTAENYARLTVEPNLWLAFRGVGCGVNMLINMASIEHDPSEADNLPFAEGHIDAEGIWV